MSYLVPLESQLRRNGMNGLTDRQVAIGVGALGDLY
jgi:hypothetical protein